VAVELVNKSVYLRVEIMLMWSLFWNCTWF